MAKSDKRIHKRRKVRRPSRWPDGTRHYVVYDDGQCDEFSNPEWSRALKQLKQDVAYQQEDRRNGRNLDLPFMVLVVHAMPRDDR